MANNQLDSLIIYAIPVNKEHEQYAHHLIHRTNSCVPISSLIYQLWLRWTLNITARNEFFHVRIVFRE